MCEALVSNPSTVTREGGKQGGVKAELQNRKQKTAGGEAGGS